MSSKVIHLSNAKWPKFWRLLYPENNKTKLEAEFQMWNKLERYKTTLYTDHFFFFSNLILRHRIFQIKHIWIWNVNLYKKDSHFVSIINKPVLQRQLHSSSENITHVLPMNLSDVFTICIFVIWFISTIKSPDQSC